MTNRHDPTLPYWLVLVRRRKPREKWYVRAYPRTAIMPTLAQVEQRIRFGEAAKRAKGRRGLAPDGLPWAAHFVKEGASGPLPEELRKPPREPEWLRRLRLLVRLAHAVSRAEMAKRAPAV